MDVSVETGSEVMGAVSAETGEEKGMGSKLDEIGLLATVFLLN